MEAKPTSGEDWTEESRVRQGLLIGGPYKEVRRGMGISQLILQKQMEREM